MAILHKVAFLVVCSLMVTSGLMAQTGRIQGRVTKSIDGSPAGAVRVSVEGTGINTVTNASGEYTLSLVPVGPHTILFRWLGYQPQQATVTVRAGQTATADATLDAQIVNLAEIIVEGASRTPERIVEAPAAVTVISAVTMRNQSLTGQAPRALDQVPGVDVVQSGVNDFNVNARGFNSSLNRRVLVLQDGRDLAIAFLGSQEWNSMSLPLEDFAGVEVVRGPGSALYGANAFAGVINMTTPAARDVVGTKVSIGGGELSTFKFDLRHAGTGSDGRLGYRFNTGYYRSNSFTRSRTAFDGSDVIAEYNDVADMPLVAGTSAGVSSCTGVDDCISIERLALAGQDVNPGTGVASGDPDALQNIYGSGRIDYYADNGAVFTVDAGATQVENEVFVTGIGRVQVTKALRPWARLAWGSEHYNLMAWYSGRTSSDPQFSLGAGIPLEESSAILHFEGQYNRSFADDRARVVMGSSFRNYSVNTDMTLMNAQNDDRNDNYYSVYGQFEYRPIPEVRLVAAARVDDGTLFDTQFSPKAAVVYSPNENHAIRASVNRAFQTPNYSEFFLRVPAGLPQGGPDSLENGLEAYFAALQNPLVVGPALATAMQQLNLPTDIPWEFAPQTPVLALGNPTLDVETVTGWELGYKGNFAGRAYVSIDFYFNRLSDFVTDLLPGVNPQFPQFALDSGGLDLDSQLAAIDAILSGAGLPANHPLRATRTQLQAGLDNLQASPVNSPALTTVNGVRALVVSYANAGTVDEVGVELGIGYGFTPELRGDLSYTFFDFDVQDPGLVQAGQDLVPNTTKHKGGMSLTYTGQQGFDANVAAKVVDGFDWAAGIFAGRVPSSQTVDVSIGYLVNNNLRLYALATNVFDQERFQLFGGSVIGRRLLAGATATF